jgi:hypothetical protein
MVPFEPFVIGSPAAICFNKTITSRVGAILCLASGFPASHATGHIIFAFRSCSDSESGSGSGSGLEYCTNVPIDRSLKGLDFACHCFARRPLTGAKEQMAALHWSSRLQANDLGGIPKLTPLSARGPHRVDCRCIPSAF